MKRAFSLILSFIMIISVAVSATSIYASDITATDKLLEIQKQNGFVNGGESIIKGNCYGFVSEVCKKLYGVPYAEGLYNTYQVKQNSGNFVTKAVFTSPKVVPDAQFVEEVFTFFTTNAVAGDIIHYGGLSNSKSHTAMIYYIDNEKMQIYHSNYGNGQYASTTCHIDTVYWQSMRDNPTTTIRNSDDTIYSMNGIFYSTMKTTNSGGIGMSISHFKNYDSLFTTINMDGVIEEETTVPITQEPTQPIMVTKQECDKIYFSWQPIENATGYHIDIQNKTKGSNFSKDVAGNITQSDIHGLDPGNIYSIKVCGIFGKQYGEYSEAVVTASKPKKEAIKSIYSSGSKKIYTKWKAPAGSCTGYEIQYCLNKSFSSGVISKNITSKSKISYTRKNLKSGKTYYVRVRAYTSYDGKKIFGTWSAVKSVKCK